MNKFPEPHSYRVVDTSEDDFTELAIERRHPVQSVQPILVTLSIIGLLLLTWTAIQVA